MENGVKTIVIIGSVLVTLIVLGLGFSMSKMGDKNLNDSVTKTTSTFDALSAKDFTNGEGSVVLGTEVQSVIESNKAGEVMLLVQPLTLRTGGNYAPGEGDFYNYGALANGNTAGAGGEAPIIKLQKNNTLKSGRINLNFAAPKDGRVPTNQNVAKLQVQTSKEYIATSGRFYKQVIEYNNQVVGVCYTQLPAND